MSLRTERIGEQLREEIARVLRDVVSDPRVHDITLTRVDVAPDLGNAIVHWSFFNPDPGGSQGTEGTEGEEGKGEFEALLAEVADGLRSCSGFVRHRVAQTLELRRTPELRFRYDSSLQLAGETMDLLRAIQDGKETNSESE